MGEWPPRLERDDPPGADREYWDEEHETMAPEARRAVILERINEQVRYAYEHSEFYREFYEGVDVDPTDITSFEEFERLPVLRSSDIRAEQRANPPFGRHLCVDESAVRRVYGTSGTTGRPKVFGIGGDDWERIRTRHAQILWSVGLRPDDRVIIASPFIQYIGSWGALAGVDRLGCTTFPFGAGIEGQTEQAVEWIADLQPDALYGTPSYALYLGETARDRGYDPATDFNFRLMFFSGEPGASVPSTRRQIEALYDCAVIDQGSMAEMTPWMTSSGCRHLENGMHLWQDVVYTQLVDPGTEEVVDFGGEGVPVYTHLERTSQPMIRYWSGDLATWVSHEDTDCECGRTYPTLPDGLYGRVDDQLVVRGKNVFPSQIEDALHALDSFGEEFRIVVDDGDGPLQTLSIVAEIATEAAESRDEFGEAVRRAIKTEAGVNPEVTVVGQGTLQRTQFKADRVTGKPEIENVSEGER